MKGKSGSKSKHGTHSLKERLSYINGWTENCCNCLLFS